jgi:Plasmid pRiA4b ORF-3-like protein
VALGDVWRRIAIPAEATLDDLVNSILKSVGFDDDHLYEFAYRDRFGATVRVEHPDSHEGPWTDEVRVGDLPLEPGQMMTLTYDFGDEWQFEVRLERIEPPGSKIKVARILERHGKAPEQYPEWD